MTKKTSNIEFAFPERIYLVGFMGCGKSTAGKRLARRLGYRFVDLDKLIEAQYKTSIPLLFEQYDENAFRILEQKALHQTSTFRNTVIATGGGAPCFFDNMDFIKAHGLAVYIYISPKGLADRLLHAKRKRPLISGISEDELVDHITEKLESRKDFYEQAHITVDGINLTAALLEEAIKDYALR